MCEKASSNLCIETIYYLISEYDYWVFSLANTQERARILANLLSTQMERLASVILIGIFLKLIRFWFCAFSATQSPITSAWKDRSPHCITWLFVVSFWMTWNWADKLTSPTLMDSVFSRKLILKRSPKQEPICLPCTTSSGEQQYPQEDSDGFAADSAYILVLLGSFVNIEPDSHALNQVMGYLQIEDEFFILALHRIECGLQFVSMEILVREGDEAWGSVVRKIQEHMISTLGLQDSGSSLAGDSCFVASKDSDEDLRSHQFAGIVDLNALVDIHSWILLTRLIEYFSLEGVLYVVSQVVVSQRDYSVGIELVLYQDLIRMVDIRLVPIICPRVRPSHQHRPVFAPRQQGEAEQYSQYGQYFH